MSHHQLAVAIIVGLASTTYILFEAIPRWRARKRHRTHLSTRYQFDDQIRRDD